MERRHPYAVEKASQKDEAISSISPRPTLPSPEEVTYCRLVVYLMAIY
jgi:hypothetical protein